MSDEKIRIPFKPIDLKNQKPIAVKECFIELYENYLRWFVDFLADEPIIQDDTDSGWEETFNYYDIIALKKNIAGVQLEIMKNKEWVVAIVVNGFGSDVKVYYKRRSEAQELFDKVKNWLLVN